MVEKFEISTEKKPKINTASSLVNSGSFRELKPGFVYVVPTLGAIIDLGNSQAPWIHFEKPWIDYNPPKHDDEWVIVDFRGDLTRQLAVDMAKRNVRMTKGSIENKQWSISVPKENLDEVKNLLIRAKMNLTG